MQGYAYTIFAGDQVEKFDLEVLGILPDMIGPKQAVILVRLKGPKVEHTGVAAGMSGSPVYLDGKLAGALSLRIGAFNKDPIAGVTPIDDVLHPVESIGSSPSAQILIPPVDQTLVANSLAAGARGALPAGLTLQPIETPLIFSGFQPSVIQQFAGQVRDLGFVATQGGSSAPQADDGHLAPGDMAGMALVQGDVSMSAACTVTAVQEDRVYLCGHPFQGLGAVQLPLARTRVVTTLASELDSQKVVNVGGSIGTVTGDYLTAVTGKLGPAPATMPVELTMVNGNAQKALHFNIVYLPKMTPFLTAVTALNALTENKVLQEGNTLHLSGEIRVRGHAPVRLENTYAPSDTQGGDAFPIALNLQMIFARLFLNSYDAPQVESVSLRVESTPGRKSYVVEGAWLEEREAAPGETVPVRVLLRPYRDSPRIVETTIRVPEQVSRGTTLRVLVSDGDTLSRSSGSAFPSGSSNLDQLIATLNRARRNDRLYAAAFLPSPALLWGDKELGNAPLSQINVIDGRSAPGNLQILRESLVAESSVPLEGPVSGAIFLNLQVR
jgi:hypothetical protein